MLGKVAKLQDLDWDDLRIFRAFARDGSFAKAADATGQHETTIARRVRRLERATGHVLWRGGGAGITDEGRRLLIHIERMEAEAAAALHDLSGDGGAVGAARITAVPWLVDTALLPVVPGWCDGNPKVRLSVIADHANLSLLRGEADIALRLARPSEEAEAVTRKLCDVPFVVAGNGDWIGYVPEMAHVPQAQWTEAGQGPTALRVSDVMSAHAAVRRGLGKAWLPLCMTKGLQSGGTPARERPLWCVLHPRSRHAPAVRAVVDDMLPLVMDRVRG